MSALLWRGKPYQLLEAIRERSNLQLYSSGALLEELADVLTRPSATTPRAHFILSQARLTDACS